MRIDGIVGRHEAYEAPKIGFGPFPDGAPGRSGASGLQVHKPRRGRNPPNPPVIRLLGSSRGGVAVGWRGRRGIG